VIKAQTHNISVQVRTASGNVSLDEGPHSFMAEISLFKVLGFLKSFQPAEMSLMWEGPELNRTMVTGYHDVSAHECAGKCTKCTTYPARYRINGALCT